MPVAGVVHHQIDDDAHPAPVRFVEQECEVCVRAVLRIDGLVVHGVVAVVTRRLEDRHEPDAVDAEVVGRGGIAVVEIVELRDQAVQISDAVTVGVGEATYEDLVGR